jgi:hypothetical protein
MSIRGNRRITVSHQSAIIIKRGSYKNSAKHLRMRHITLEEETWRERPPIFSGKGTYLLSQTTLWKKTF